MSGSLPYQYAPLESGIAEYKNRTVDWNAYEEAGLIGSDVKQHIIAFGNGSTIPADGHSILKSLKTLNDFIGRIKILCFLEAYFADIVRLKDWIAQGSPSLSLLLIDSAVLDLEAYQKCKLLLHLSLNGVVEAAESLLSFLKHCLQQDDKDALLLSSSFLQFFLEKSDNREAFARNRSDIVNLLFKQLSLIKQNQAQYQILFCIWLLSFSSKNCRLILSFSGSVSILADVARSAVKEKVARLTVSVLLNILKACKQEATPIYVGSKLLPLLETMSTRKYSDPEFNSELSVLLADMRAAIQNLRQQFDSLIHSVAELFSTFDEYASEVKSGHLEWSPPHRSELFWKDNAAKLDLNDLELLRCLAEILRTSNDPQRLAIVCSDIGEYIDHHPTGKRYIEKLEIKQEIMKLITHPDTEVRYHALSAVQRYLSGVVTAL